MGNNCCARAGNTGDDMMDELHHRQSHMSDGSLMASTETNSYREASVLSQGTFSQDPNYSSTEVSIEDFTIVRVIGRGSFGKVYLVKKKSDGKVYAMKTLKKDMILRKNQTSNTKGK